MTVKSAPLHQNSAPCCTTYCSERTGKGIRGFGVCQKARCNTQWHRLPTPTPPTCVGEGSSPHIARRNRRFPGKLSSTNDTGDTRDPRHRRKSVQTYTLGSV